jgi:predicted metal-binding membrane protein
MSDFSGRTTVIAGSIQGFRDSEQDGLTAPLTAMRTELGIVAVLLAAAGLAWFSTADRMAGMDAGPGSSLGALGWFTGVWAVMMAAMMLPSLAPTAAVYTALVRREPSRILLFAAGYLLVWSLAGVLAYGLFELGKSLFSSALAWHSSGRWLAAAVLLLAALYQLTPFKRAFLTRCRSPLRFLHATWREDRLGAFVMGLRNGGWCLGCSWALMAALFALGVMSLTWMALIAGLVALEKVGPWGGAAKLATAGVLVVLAVAILTVPHEVPGFVVPGSPGSMHSSMPTMKAMG